MSRSKATLIIFALIALCAMIIFLTGTVVMIKINDIKICQHCNFGTDGYRNSEWEYLKGGYYNCFNIDNQTGRYIYKNAQQRPVCQAFTIIMIMGLFISTISSIICAFLAKSLKPLAQQIISDEIRSTDDSYQDVDINLAQSGVTPYARYYEIHEEL